jgi:multicomponent Na+:H+ antiporter subunit D
VVFQLQLLLFSGLAFFLMLGLLKRTLTNTHDVDWLYRRLGVVAAKAFDRWVGETWARLTAEVERGAHVTQRNIQRAYGPDSMLARTWSTGGMTLWTTVIMAAYLLLLYL